MQMRRVLAGVAVVIAILFAWLAYRLNDRPSLEAHAERVLRSSGRPPGGVRITFLGVSTLLVEDGETAILTDGFFTRPGKLRTVLGRIAPDRDRIGRALERAGISRLAAVIVAHSHYDHAMDAPEVAERTGALLVGSESTANIGRGWGLAEDRMRVVHGGETMELGKFRVRVVATRHFPHRVAMGEIEAPLRPPARATAYREGGSFSILIERGEKTMLVQASAGFVEGGLQGRKADVVFLGMAGLGGKDEAYREAYWREVVQAVRGRRVIPIHWDDFSRPLDQPLVPFPRLLDDFDASMRFVVERAGSERVDVRLVDAWETVDPWGGL
jgi:L-ascorbate metabolism protein UlaG (beta-lactamase superfamily)